MSDRPLESLVIDGVEVDAKILGPLHGPKKGSSVTSGTLIRTMRGASSVEISVFDPDRVLLKSGILVQPGRHPRNKVLEKAAWDRIGKVELTLRGYYFRLAGIDKDGDILTLTFEDQIAALLRRHSRPRKSSRASETRAGFVASLLSEVKEITIPSIITDPNKRQPIYSVEGETKREREQTRKQKRREQRDELLGQKGIAADADITVKGVKATPQQIEAIEEILAEADRLGASRRVMIACIMCVTEESTIAPLSHGDEARNDTIGYYQQGPEWIDPLDTKNPTLTTRAFLTKPGRGWKATHGSLRNGRGNLSHMIHAVQDNAVADTYARWEKEATKTVDAFDGGRGDGYTVTRTLRETYYFRRGGENGEREDSWEATGRLAEEVNWRRFTSQTGTFHAFYFVNDEWLFKARPRLTLTEKTEGVTGIDFQVDYGKPVSTVTVTARTDLFSVPPGSVVVLKDLGPANGRWLVEEIRTDLFTPETTIELRRPSPSKPEPAPKVSERSVTVGANGGGGSAEGLRARIVEIAKASMTVNTRFSRYAAIGPPAPQNLNVITPATGRSDCSQWIHAVYAKAGAPSPGANTYQMAAKGKRTKTPKPGDIMLTANVGHCELYVGPSGKTVGHGTAPIDEANVSAFPGAYFVTFPFLDGG